jgi:hypothetical protein
MTLADKKEQRHTNSKVQLIAHMYEKADLRMNVGHFKISSSLTTLSKKTFGDSVK